MHYFRVTLNVTFAYKRWLFQNDHTCGYCVQGQVSLKGIQTIQMGYFKATMHVGIAFRVDSSSKLAIPALILTFTNWNFGVSLQYPHLYLPLLTRILGLCCDTCTYTYLYQLKFWGLIIILALVLTSTNQDFEAQLQYLYLTLILSLYLCFCISNFLCLLLGNNNKICAILDFMCVLNT